MPPCRLSLDDRDQPGLLHWAKRWMLEDSESWPDAAYALGIREVKTGLLRGVFVTVQTYAGIVDLHIATDGSRRWASRNILRGLFGYMFLVQGAFRVQTIHPTTDEKTSHLCRRVGFAEEAVIPSGIAPGLPGRLFGMLRNECPWLDDQDKGARTHG